MDVLFTKRTTSPVTHPLSLHDALPISGARHGDLRAGRARPRPAGGDPAHDAVAGEPPPRRVPLADRKSTRLNSSHGYISYAVFCLKKNKTRRRRGRDLRL